jgi:hypothetical protein
MGYRRLPLHVLLFSAACLAQVASPPQPASLASPFPRESAATGNGSCEAIASGNQQLAPLAKLCEFALNYQQELPDLLAEMTITEHRPQFATVVTAQVTFSHGHESYSATSVDGKPVEVNGTTKLPSVAMRFTSSGEFGSLLVDLFHPGFAEFKFSKQATLHGTAVLVYGFHVPASSNTLWAVTDDFGHTVHPEIRGELWVEAGTSRLMRESLEPAHLPASFEIVRTATTIDYAVTTIGDAGVFVLPSKSETTLCEREQFSGGVSCITNTKSFGNYRKFAATTRILADVPQQ